MRLALLFSAALLAPPAATPTVKSGVEAWSRGNYASAITTWRVLAAKGDPDAMFNLGQAYRLGRGVNVDLSESMGWYAKAANAGHVDAQTQLGILLFQNGNQLSGLRWLHMAADKGEPRAQLLYGTALFNGDGLVKRDPALAYAYVAKAAAQGLAPAKTTLAEMDKAIPSDVRQRTIASTMPAVGTKTRAASPKLASTATLRPSGKPTADDTGSWRVQLGAFGQRSAAEALFRKLAAGPLGGKQPFLIPVGAVTRLQAGPFANKAAASSACSSLSGRGQACFVVPAR